MKPSTARLIECFTSINVLAQNYFGDHKNWRKELATCLYLYASVFRNEKTSDHIAMRRMILNSLQCRVKASEIMDYLAKQLT